MCQAPERLAAAGPDREQHLHQHHEAEDEVADPGECAEDDVPPSRVTPLGADADEDRHESDGGHRHRQQDRADDRRDRALFDLELDLLDVRCHQCDPASGSSSGGAYSWPIASQSQSPAAPATITATNAKGAIKTP